MQTAGHKKPRHEGGVGLQGVEFRLTGVSELTHGHNVVGIKRKLYVVAESVFIH